MAVAEARAACAMCGRPAIERFRPFCSKRCADLDLSRWLSGVYALPAEEEDQHDPDGEIPEPRLRPSHDE